VGGGEGGGGVRSVSALFVYQISSERSEKTCAVQIQGLYSRIQILMTFVRKDRRSRVIGKKVLIYYSTMRSWGLPLLTKSLLGFQSILYLSLVSGRGPYVQFFVL
jgi:hypothetical protein